VLTHGDVREDYGPGLTLRRISRMRSADPSVRKALGKSLEAGCALNVVWDEREDQLVRCFDTPARPEQAQPFGAYAPPFDEDDSEVWGSRPGFGLAF
jgi:hypothetical protein